MLACGGAFIWAVMLPLRLTAAGQETANRAEEFVYLGIGPALGLLMTVWLNSDRLARRVAVVVIIAVIVAGGIAVSDDYRQRLAPDNAIPREPLSTTPQERAASQWFLAQYGPNRRVATDLSTDIVFGSAGRQNPLSDIADYSHVWMIFYPTSLTSGVYSEIRRSHVQFIVVDQFLSLEPVPGWPVFDSGDPVRLYLHPVPVAALEKFNTSPNFQLVYTSTETDIYEVSPSLSDGGS